MFIFFKTLIFLAIGLSIIIFSLYKTPVRNLQQKDYKVEVNQYSLIFYTNQLEQIFKISPLDDYYYLNDLKDHLIGNSSFNQQRNLFTEFILTLEKLFLRQNHLIWSLKKDQLQVIYQIEDLGNKVKISRTLKGFDPKIGAMGQAITFCQDCFLVDENNQVFLMDNLLTEEKLDKITRLKLTPVIISNEQLPKISKLIILNPFGERRLELTVAENQQAFYFENWHVLELKTPTKKLTATQIVSLSL